MPRQLIIAKAAEELRCSQVTLRRWIKKGELAAIQQPTASGFVWLVTLSDPDPELIYQPPETRSKSCSATRGSPRHSLTPTDVRRVELHDERPGRGRGCIDDERERVGANQPRSPQIASRGATAAALSAYGAPTREGKLIARREA